MPLLACGINHQTAPVAIREKLAFTQETTRDALLNLMEQVPVSEAVILSTCNRTELYCAATDPTAIIKWLQQHQQVPQNMLTACVYTHSDYAAVRHILRVASGLDSMIIGEPQILGQVKSAFSLAHTAGTLGSQLYRLFHYVFSVTKQVRTQTAIGIHPVSIAYTAVDLVKHIFSDLTQKTALLIGAGETIELTARHLRAAGVSHLWVANRTLAKAKKLADRIQGQPITLGDIPNYLSQTDMVVSATASPLPLLGKGMVERAIKIRKHRPIFMIDLAVPRDIEAEVGELNDVYLYTVDDLQNIIQENLQNRQAAASQAEAIINAKATQYMQTLKVLEAVPIICSYREKAESLRDAEHLKALQLLQSGLPAEEVLQKLARNLTNKLLHAPSVQLRQAAYAEQDELIELAKKLFEL